MGLREINAARTRSLIVEGAMELFVEHGYEATTMEEVASRVGIGLSTLYRYFPTKEQLAIAPIGDPGLMGRAVAERPADEPPSVALGHALTSFISRTEENLEQALYLQRLMTDTPRLEARLLEWFVTAQREVAEALCVRRGRPSGDPSCVASAWVTLGILMSLDLAMQSGDDRPAGQVVASLVERLGEDPPLLPEL